ncbi:zinc finger protein 808-like [Bombyx mandarina]|uniref:Zinc finger protein 808-like n=1 Tax=Bombyx mandarina TaxID=7092 RepID=A0A6J2JS27_BOMMA|nr:zinc finger protein 808-like [Bombyx mandarina]
MNQNQNMSTSLLDYVCDYCNRIFTRKYNLQTHIENLHVNSSCHCEVCGKRFGTTTGFHLHLSAGHNRYGQPLPECDLCGRIFTRKQNIVSHMITVHLQGLGNEIRCRFCSKTFTTGRNLKRHVNLLHNPNVEYPTCDICKKVFKGKPYLVTHIQSMHKSERESIKCNMCDKAYTNERNLKRHVDMFHGVKGEHHCGLCPKVYLSNQSLKRHLRTRHLTGEEQYRCEYCNTVFKGNEELEAHVRSLHAGEVSETTDEESRVDRRCEDCDQTFPAEKLLRQHVKNVHTFSAFYKYCKDSLTKRAAGVPKDLYHCESCREGFITVYELKTHMRITHDIEYSLSTCNVCFERFYSKLSMAEHKRRCLPPPDAKACSYCDKLFTDVTSLEFHTRIFHPQARTADPDTRPANRDGNSFKCVHCHRIYYSERSLKHHIKLKHSTDEAMECKSCGKICSNKYYLASHMKIVHSTNDWSKCDFCDKQFKSKRNIRRHIEYTHMGMQRHKCIECETLFKEKRSLRKHVRSKHPNSALFPQCHICYKRFESAKSCKIHLKLLHAFNMDTFPCHLCSVSFGSDEALSIHLKTKHLVEDQIYKCEECNLVFKGQDKFDAHNETRHVNSAESSKQKVLPRCILCMKDFSTRKTLKRHIKKFHEGFDADDLASFGSKRRAFSVDCEDCQSSFNDDFHYSVYMKLRHLRESVVFECGSCGSSYNSLEFAIQRYKTANADAAKGKMILSDLCTAEMSDGDADNPGCGSAYETTDPGIANDDAMLESQGLCA